MVTYSTLKNLDSRWTDELCHKYFTYVHRKEKIRDFGRTAIRDSTRSKVYASERSAASIYWSRGNRLPSRSIKEMQKRTNTIIKSKTWRSMLENNSVRPREIQIKEMNSRAYLGMAYHIEGVITLSNSGLTDDTLIHELAHMVGNWHHDIRFRMQQIKLASRFISPIYAKILAKEYRNHGLKINQNVTIKTPEQWLDSYCHMKRVRSARK